MNNNNPQPSAPEEYSHKLRGIAGELKDVHMLLSTLHDQLGGGGIIQAGHVEPTLASAVPKLGNAVRAMNKLTGDSTDDSKPPNPLLI